MSKVIWKILVFSAAYQYAESISLLILSTFGEIFYNDLFMIEWGHVNMRRCIMNYFFYQTLIARFVGFKYG